jgi:hypothetical protein
MKILMFGQLPDLIKTFRDGGTNLQEQLFAASAEDQRALASQSHERAWNPIISAIVSAEDRIKDFYTIPI